MFHLKINWAHLHGNDAKKFDIIHYIVYRNVYYIQYTEHIECVVTESASGWNNNLLMGVIYLCVLMLVY